MTKRTGLGTAKFINPYYRPDRISVNKNDELEFYSATVRQLETNVYILRQIRAYGGRHYLTAIMMKDKDGWFKFDVPTNKYGEILPFVMVQRFLDTDTGDREGRQRNVLIDCAITARQIFTSKDLANAYRWYLYPNETDVKNIDDAKTKLVQLLAKTPKGYKTTLFITGGTERNRNDVAEAIKNNFTVREKRIIGGCLIQITSLPYGTAGSFSGESDANGKPVGTPIIRIHHDYADKSDVIIHEAVHALRQFDVKRNPKLRGFKLYVGRDADLEESLTEAETVAREKPLKKHESRVGYYHYIKIPDPKISAGSKTIKDMIVEDRITITNPGEGDYINSGLKGKRAEKALILKYPATNISKLKIKGDVEAIDTYYHFDKGETKTSLQIYAPKGNIAYEKQLDKGMSKLPVGVTKYRDNKPIQLSKRTSRITPKMPRLRK